MTFNLLLPSGMYVHSFNNARKIVSRCERRESAISFKTEKAAQKWGDLKASIYRSGLTQFEVVATEDEVPEVAEGTAEVATGEVAAPV